MRKIRHRDSPRARTAGFSLIELMLSMAIGLFLLTVMAAATLSGSQGYKELQNASQRMENGRYAMQLLITELQHAGFYGEYYEIPSPPATLPDPCLTPLAALQAALPLPVQGYDSPGTSPLSCLAAADHVPGTDILVTRRVSTASTGVGALQPGRVYLQGRPDSVVMDTGSNPGAFTLVERDGVTPADIREYQVAIYFISPCHVPTGTNCDASADGGNPVPTLKRLELAPNGTATVMSILPLVEGIENFQIEYGLDRNGDGAPNESAAGANDIYVTAPATADWANVVSLRLHLLGRNVQPTSGHQDAKTYNLGPGMSLGPFNDRFKRQVISGVVRVTNPSSRRETP